LSLWYCRNMLAGFNEVDEKVEGFTSEEVRRGEKDFYDFICRMYEDMYKKPESFMIPVGLYDEYLKKAATKKRAEKKHYTDARESRLWNEFQHAIQYYAKFLYEIGSRAKYISAVSHALHITEYHYEEAKKASEMTYINGDHESRREAWNMLGMRFVNQNGMVTLSNQRNPDMFIGLWILCRAPESACKYMNYLRVDFKGCYRAMPQIEDIRETMLPKHARMIDRLEEAMADLPMKRTVQRLRNITSGFQWKVAYTYKVKNVFGFYAEPKYLLVCIYFNDVKNINEMAGKLLKTDIDLFGWFKAKFPERLCKCRNNRWVVFGKERRRICGLSCRADVENPKISDIAASIKVMKLFRGLQGEIIE